MIYRPLSTNKYLNYCAEIEKCAFLIYDSFARDESDTSLSHTWKALAEEEKQHADQIELLSRLSRGLKCRNNRFDDQEILKMARNAEAYLDTVYHSLYSPYFACNLSVHLESHFFELHAHQRAVFAGNRFQNLFHNLAEDDTEHIRKIQSLYATCIDQ